MIIIEILKWLMYFMLLLIGLMSFTIVFIVVVSVIEWFSGWLTGVGDDD